jgi:hypothetical protein
MRKGIKRYAPHYSVLFLCFSLVFLPLLAQASGGSASGWKMIQGQADIYDTMGEPPAPRISPPGGTYFAEQTVTVHCRVPGATVHYTTDGSTPDEFDPEYTGPIDVDVNTTVKARAYLDDWPPGHIATAAYELKVATPELEPPGGSWDGPISVTITTDTPASNIRYTTDGSTPTASYGSLYMGAIYIDSYTVINAIAYRSGWSDSDVATETYDASDKLQAGRREAVGASIQFEIRHSGHVKAQVFDVRGRLAATPFEGYHSAGSFSCRWDPASAGEAVRPGVYFVRVELDGQVVGTAKTLVTR